MSGDLDDILIDTECPRCGATIRAKYGDVKLTHALACGCGALIRVDLSDTKLDAVERLINEVSVPTAQNDPS